MLGVLSIVLTLIALMYFAYRGVTVLVLAPALAMLAALLSGEIPPLVALSEVFMPAAAGYIKSYWPVFLVGAIFGQLMGATGAATSIAKYISNKVGPDYAIYAIVIATAVLTYGGVSLFVVVFAMYPIGAMLLKEAGMPKRFLPASIALGSFTFTMTALPGSPQYLNTLPIKYFDTTIYAGPILGILGATIMFFGGVIYLNYRVKLAMAKSEDYGIHENEGLKELSNNIPSFTLAVLPLIVVFVINFVMTNWYVKNPSFIDSYALAGYKLNGTWPVIVGLSVAIILVLIMFNKYLKDPNKEVFDGAIGGLLPIFNTGSEVGYGGVIKSLAAFGTLKAFIVALSIPSIFKVIISTTLLAGIVGSASGGTAIALEVLAPEFLNMGINPEALHRLMLMSAGGLDTLPHCGAVITLLAVCRLTHKQSYLDIAVVTMGIPLIAVIVTGFFYLVTGIV